MSDTWESKFNTSTKAQAEDKQYVIDTIRQALEEEAAREALGGGEQGGRLATPEPVPQNRDESFRITEVEVFASDGTFVGSRLVSSVFYSGETSYLGVMVHFEPKDYNRTAHLAWKIYKESGEAFTDDIMADIIVVSGNDQVFQQWGWQETGNWQPGKYVAVVTINGGEPVHAWFNVKRGRLDALNSRINDVKLFNSVGEVPPLSERTYGMVYNQDELGRLYFQFEFNQPGRDVRTLYEYCIWDEAGNVVENIADYVYIEADYGFLWFGYGWDEPGCWAPGSYQYRVSLGKSQYYTGEFYVREATPTQSHPQGFTRPLK